MPRDNPAAREGGTEGPGADRRVPRRRAAAGPNQRCDPRSALAVQALVEIAGLTSRPYAVSEISRGGMSLAYRDARSTLLELEQAKVEPGTGVEIAFLVTVAQTKHRLRVRARLARITRHGIGVEFTTRNPPQLAALRELFAEAERQATPDGQPSVARDRGPNRSGILARPTAAPDWELLD